MSIDDLSAFKIYKGTRLYDDEQPLKKIDTPDFDRPIDAAPYIVVVQGPRNIGKSLLIKSLVKKFTGNPPVDDPVGSVTIPIVTPSSGKQIQLQFVECPDDTNGMIDAAKYADVAILVVDASYGFEMETFEFRNLLQVHGFPKVIGVLTHLDNVGDDEVSEVKRRLKDHFCTEICEGAEVFSLSGLQEGLYKTSDIENLVEVLSDSQFLPLSWRTKDPHLLVDRCEVDTPGIDHGDKQCNRNITLYGHLRGSASAIKEGAKVHIAGAGDFDFSFAGLTSWHAPCATGFYLGLHVLDVPPDLVRHPILVGFILPGENNSGYMQVKLRRHSWRPDLLMTGAPVTVSAGWRRYQTTAFYAVENENGQHQLVSFTPEHKDCLAVFWGPLAPPNTKIVFVEDKFDCSKDKEAFRIAAKGVVLDFNREAQILLLKVENIGTVHMDHPLGKTAHINFAPELKHEIDKFIGASIQTKSGVWGTIDKAAGDGIVKCTFKDDVQMSDSFLFPVLAILMLPSLFKQLNLRFKPLEMAVSSSPNDIIAANIAAVNDAVTAAVAATIAAVAATTNATISVEDELAVSYQEVDPRRKMMTCLRRKVVIHEGKRGYSFLPNPLESFYSSVERKNKTSPQQQEEWLRYMVTAIKKRKLRFAPEISGEVGEPGRSAAEPMVFEHVAKRPGESAAELYFRRYGRPVLHS